MKCLCISWSEPSRGLAIETEHMKQRQRETQELGGRAVDGSNFEIEHPISFSDNAVWHLNEVA